MSCYSIYNSGIHSGHQEGEGFHHKMSYYSINNSGIHSGHQEAEGFHHKMSYYSNITLEFIVGTKKGKAFIIKCLTIV